MKLASILFRRRGAYFCFSRQLYLCTLFCRPGDLLLARDGGEGGRRYGLLQRIEAEEGGSLACRLAKWGNGQQIYSALEDELHELGPLEST